MGKLFDELEKIIDNKENENEIDDQLKMGIEVEKEHNDMYEFYDKLLKDNDIENPLTPEEFYAMVAKAHIKELKDYYTKLAKMENG